MNKLKLQDIIREALAEDLGFGDLTSDFFPGDHNSTGIFTAKAEGVLAGLDVITEVYRQLDDSVNVDLYKDDGDIIQKGEEIARAEGPTAALLNGERVILNLLQHMSGIATGTKQAVEALHSAHTRICDTRKTLPGLRMLQKYAVRCGGGYNHRYRLDDGVMLKDNHIKAAGSIGNAVKKLRSQLGHMVSIEVETETRDQVLQAVESGAEIVMFDNRSPEEVAEFVELVPDHVITEVSGGITIDTIGDYRDSGVDYISMGSLTHTVTALDISFNLNQ
ncbi:carboxylating nicotinate-nucleotide diphosphorylase [Aliifodinibius sp. S!AR15-10]|uniref:carboxylating nicotinate-nucleotide diphosphorylase n=1 Tax=Aliifodinibius sp. S!AR15-10 TaxID=2950437 RepID=UPI00285513E4|nr:carboxylating nicotinate-nucleotide diphosphorylase [Aliifodinibius sp. S!AR15-10]MDR8393673.1 carboxylating nicotinate-nucleotide diphosphorylase [Aliifodinibius sp. S!AR15-10]